MFPHEEMELYKLYGFSKKNNILKNTNWVDRSELESLVSEIHGKVTETFAYCRTKSTISNKTEKYEYNSDN